MCRLTAYLGTPTLAADLITRPSRSVIRQSFDARERLGGSGGQVYDIGNLNADGFGVGWYAEGEDADITPCVFTEVGPAWHNRNLHRLARKIRSGVILAHVRAAGPGMGVCHCSCHPFEFGRFLFMHNGQVAGFGKIRRKLMSTLNSRAFDFAIANSASDSAVAFALFIDQLEDAMAAISPAVLQEKLVKVIRIICEALEEAKIQETTLLNFVVSDGNAMAATRFACHPEKEVPAATLYFSSGTRFEANDAETDAQETATGGNAEEMANGKACGGGKCGAQEEVKEFRMVHEDRRSDVVIITSEPLTNMRADWVSVPNNYMVLVTPLRQVLLAPIDISQRPCGNENNNQDFNEVLETFGHDKAAEKAEPDALLDWRREMQHQGWDGLAQISPRSPRPYLQGPDSSSSASGKPKSFFDHAREITRAELLRGSNVEGHGKGCPPGCSCMPSSNFDAGLKTFLGLKERPARAPPRTKRLAAPVEKAEEPDVDPPFLVSAEGFASSQRSGSIDDSSRGGAIARAGSADAQPAETAPAQPSSNGSGLGWAEPGRGLRRQGSFTGQGGWTKSMMQDTPKDETTPPEHVISSSNQRAVLAMCMSSRHIFAPDGGERGHICAWDVSSWAFLSRTKPQKGGVLALCLTKQDRWLVSSQSNNEVVVWDATHPEGGLTVLSCIRCPLIGHVLALSVSPDGTLLLGSKDATVRCAKLDFLEDGAQANGDARTRSGQLLSLVDRKVVEQRKKCADAMDVDTKVKTGCESDQRTLALRECVIEAYKGNPLAKGFARSGSTACMQSLQAEAATHFSFVFAIAPCKEKICTGGGDGLINVWERQGYKYHAKLAGHRGCVMALASDETATTSTLYSGSTDGTVRVWDLEAMVCRRTLPGPSDVLCLALSPRLLVAGYASGSIKLFDVSSLATFKVLSVGDGPIHCVALNCVESKLACSTSPGRIAVWTVPELAQARKEAATREVPSISRKRKLKGTAPAQENEKKGKQESVLPGGVVAALDTDLSPVRRASAAEERGPGLQMAEEWQGLFGAEDGVVKASEDASFHALLKDFIAIPTISALSFLHEQCWHGARFVATTLELLGCQVKITGHNGRPGVVPVVLAKMTANHPQASQSEERDCVVIYGHYDVAFAEPSNWDSDPFTLEGRDGYLYGRGVSDDKGPILACFFAAKALRDKGELTVDVAFIVEGEEESGLSLQQRGFPEVVEANRRWFNNCRAIVISNNYWIDEATPCLTYGMRGVIDAELWVSGPAEDLHSGVDGGAVHEPMSDLTAVIASFHGPDGKVAIPGFYADARKPTQEEARRTAAVELRVDKYCEALGVSKVCSEQGKEVLEARWSEPCLSVSSIESTNKARVFRKIPKAVVGRVSVHFVPDQKASDLEAAFEQHARRVFEARDSGNVLKVVIKQSSGWWLGDVDNRIFRLAEKAVEDVWGQKPLMVREGGSYGGVTACLESMLGAPALHLPMGQSSDKAHLPNERIRVHNLLQGRRVMENLLRRLGSCSDA